MTRLTIDWPSAALNGRTTLASADDNFVNEVSTPAVAGGIGISDITIEPNVARSKGRAVSDDALAVAQSGDVFTRCHDASDRKFDALNLQSHGIRKIAFKDSAADSGIVTFLDNTTMSFADIERLIPCFTPGTMIATPRGEMLVENLKIGDRVLTRDNGIKTINWVGTKRLDYLMLKQLPELRPIRIKRGALGPNIPDRDMLVSPAHRMLVVSQVAQLYFNQSEVLIAAKHLLEIEGVEVAQTAYVTYIHFMCEHHEIVLSDGAWSESFQPGDYSLKGLDSDQREELFGLFPLLSTKEGVLAYRAARPTLKKEEAALIFKGR